jgi:Domain of unknown function (DUF1707)
MGDDAPVPAVRASDAEREAAIGRLRDAAAEGRLTFEELAERVELAASAVTRSDLEALTDDLPAEPPAHTRARAHPGVDRLRRCAPYGSLDRTRQGQVGEPLR